LPSQPQVVLVDVEETTMNGLAAYLSGTPSVTAPCPRPLYLAASNFKAASGVVAFSMANTMVLGLTAGSDWTTFLLNGGTIASCMLGSK
jgi:hypothetical protein